MNFSDILDYLMNLTKTSNKELAEVLFFSQSYVSKLRRGHRSLKDIESIENICEFFSNRIYLPNQLDKLREKLKMGNLPLDPTKNEIALFLMENFFSDKTDEISILDEVFYNTIEIPSLGKINIDNRNKDTIHKDANIDFNFQKNKIKYMKFLDDIIASEKIGYIFYFINSYHLIYNNDSEVVGKFEEAMNHIIKNNIKFDIVLNLGLPINEILVMFESLLKYMFYDNIKIYYLSNGNGNYVSSSLLGAHSIGICNTYGIQGTIDFETILIYKGYDEYKKMEELFYQILSKAEPLATKYNPKNFSEQLKYSKLLLNEGKNTTVSKFLSLQSMESDLLEELLDSPEIAYLLEIGNVLKEEFDRFLKENVFIEIVDKSLLNTETFIKDSYWGYVYTKSQFKRHLESVLDRLETQKNYYFILSDHIEPNIIFHVNKNKGVLAIGKDKTIKGIFSSSKFVASIFDDYIKFKLLKPHISLEEERENSINKIKLKIDSLK